MKMSIARPLPFLFAFGLSLAACGEKAPESHSLIIRGGEIVDGSGAAGFVGDVVIDGDKVVAVVKGTSPAKGKREIDATGLVVAPGFINMLSWANESLIADGRAMSDVLQGVTLEVMGEGSSMGPFNDEMKRLETERQGDIKYDIDWTTLGDYFNRMEKAGVSPNIASFVGAATVRVHELGEGDVDPTPEQLAAMRALVRDAMKEGAMGVGSSLIYAPGTFAETDELVALVSEAAACGGMYISHMRSEGTQLLEAIDELITISRESGAPAEIYHFKQGGRDNWGKIDAAIERVEKARAEGLRITADMYNYTAGATGLDAAMPTWVQAGGLEEWRKRLQDPDIRARVAAEMQAKGDGWENLYYSAGGPDRVLLAGFKNPDLKPYTGKTLAEVAALRGKSPEETAMDLVVEDNSRVGTIYFLMDEANVKRAVALPWMSFGSDEAAPATEGVFLQSNNHPRAYGNVARLLGHYVRDEGVTTLESAVHRMSGMPAANLGLKERGLLTPGYFADVVVFDPKTISDHATYDNPAQYATGVRDVFVNGVQVVKDGTHTGAKPGRAVRGPGWTGWPDGGACK
ncbi:N-acyl-D-amino-acid deacylase family protein [Pseudokordiimonas caeni]|uniref:N-acyl-D-amino-acid deacylase family protein n=1 Tax=Pseudokordiimonas caeni TaxID=2997908 RepID=UPI0028120937|nr:D-aminoacylase [Pseudokordiimonas caeni]